MTSRPIAWLVLTVLATVSLAMAMQSCSTTPTSAGLAQGCSINSDCNSPLVCAFQRCHQQCSESRDCPMNEQCLSDPKTGTLACRLPDEVACGAAGACAGGLVCGGGSDQTCKNSCTMQSDCKVAGQTCDGRTCNDVPATDGGSDSSPDTGVDSSADSGNDVTTDAGCSFEGGSDAGPLGYNPSNFDPTALAVVDGGLVDGGINWVTPPDVNIITNCGYMCMPAPSATIRLSDNSLAQLFVVHDFIIQSNSSLTLTSAAYTYPIIIAALGKVDIQGDLIAGGGIVGVDQAGPGGNPEYGVSTAHGMGGGGTGFLGVFINSASGGGGFCGTGGMGAGMAPLAPGGGVYGTADLVPLAQGSSGGSTIREGTSGGSIQISARTSITIRNIATINVGGGYHDINGGGGGSGGALLLEAPTIAIQGRVAANGGGGNDRFFDSTNATATDQPAPGGGNGGKGSAAAMINGSDGVVGDAGPNSYGAGGGGAGRIRLNTWCGAATIAPTAVISPSVAPATTCATQGTIRH